MFYHSKILVFVLLIGISCKSASAQSFKGIVLDENELPLAGVQVKDTLSTIETYTNYDGSFSIESNLNSVISVYLYGYELTYIRANQEFDTIRLVKDSRLLEGVIIRSERKRAVQSELNENVLDYMVMNDFVLSLCVQNRKRYLVASFTGQKPTIFSLGRLKAKSLALDCYGNIHILTPTHAHQIWLGNKQLEFVMEAPISQFNSILKPCIAAFDSTFIISSYANHNQKYTLASKNKGEMEFTPFHEIWDKESEEAAEALYYEIIGLYFAATDCTENVIINKVWDGDVKRLAQNYELMVRVGFYDKILSKEIDAQTFRINDQVVSFDLTFDSVQVFSNKANLLSARSFIFNEPKQVIHDRKTNSVYALYLKKGIYSIGEIKLEEQTIAPIIDLTEVPFAEKIQIYDGWVYFLSAESVFKKLYKIKL